MNTSIQDKYTCHVFVISPFKHAIYIYIHTSLRRVFELSSLS